MTYFVDPYKKNYEELSGITAIVTESETIASKVSESSEKITGLKSYLSSSGWEEMGIETLSQKTIPNLISNLQTLQNNINDCLKKVVNSSINELLPELTKLKEEDERYEFTKTELNNLVVPLQYDKDGDETASYRQYKVQKDFLEKDLDEYKKNCETYKNNCDSKINSIKSIENALEEFKVEISTSSAALDTTISLIDGESSGNVIKVSYSGKEFYVVNTKNSVIDYQKYVQDNGLYQSAGLLGNECMLLSQYYAVDLIRGTKTTRNTMANFQGSPATRINNRVSSENEDEVLQYIYSEVTQGRPTVLQVTQKLTASKGYRHLVTVVGFDSSVQSYEDLTPDKILVLDCVDGKIQTLADRERTLYNQNGKYQALGATDTFLAKEVYSGTGSYNA